MKFDTNTLRRVLYTIIWPARWVFLQGSNRVRCMIMHGERILLVQDVIGGDEWDLPGGGIQKDEMPLDGLRREINEELGIELKVRDTHELFKSTILRSGIRFNVTCFLSQVESDEFQRNKYEILKAEWFDLKELPNKVSPVVRQAVKSLEH